MDINAKWRGHVVLMEPALAAKTSPEYRPPPGEQSVRSSLESYGTIIDVQFYTFRAGWSAIFVTFENPESVDRVLREHLIRLGEKKLPYATLRMNRNRSDQYKPPHSHKTIPLGPRVPGQSFASPWGTVSRDTTPHATQRQEVSGNSTPNPAAGTPRATEPPSGPRAMRAAQTAPLARGSPSSATSMPPPKLPSADQIGLLLAEIELLSRMIKEAESLRDAKTSLVAQKNLDRIKSLQSQADDERSNRKSLEGVERDLVRELEDLDHTFRHEVRLAKRVEYDLRNISRRQLVAAQLPDQNNTPTSPRSAEISPMQDEVGVLAAHLAGIDSKIASEDESIARLRCEIDSSPKSSSVLSDGQRQGPATIPTFDEALAALNTISKGIAAQIEHLGKQHHPMTENSNAAETQVQVLKRKHSATLD